MAATSTCLTLTILVVFGTLFYNTNNVSAQCGFTALIHKCSKFVETPGPTIPPSPECCAAIKSFDLPCACKLFTKESEKFVSIQKTIFVARSCGLKVPPGMQCGSVKVPPKAMK
ncbi:uncharacterized protein LOC131607157 [Vicia villosa]|uniref:uncharacterized protein LOC131607157 n=1 Tax=Vicia villosa TaxID=3911 RepID=UPI00273C6E77|nr:uncharacterized protein LOC131607157 [Vicia villosa]